MTQDSTPAPADASGLLNPQQEFDNLLATVAGLAQMSLAMTKHCLDLQTRLPGVVTAAVANGMAALTPRSASPIVWIKGEPRTPEELEIDHPAGIADDVSYHVVYQGREPGLYLSVDDSDKMVNGVPHGKRLKQKGRIAALNYYRDRWDRQLVIKWVPESVAGAAAALAGASQARQ
ncbi:hypothetical protein C8R43DRAFT_940888 [Mycena crocata]|nr:hypothetical protein C8R43DRAFT_940888 [Mycena crocata]